MSQSSATKLISKIRFNLHDRRNLKNPQGPAGRHDKIRKTVTALFKYERIELNYHKADESRGYAERLISDAIRYGDCHKPTMEMASYWIIEKPIIHKLFKVLAPRYQNSRVSYTKLWRAPNVYPGKGLPKAILELRDNIYPPLGPDKSSHKNQLHNVLLEAARVEYQQQKILEMQNKAKESAGESQSGVKESAGESQLGVNESAEAMVDGNIDSDKMNMADNECGFPDKEKLKADSVDECQNEEKAKVNLAEEEDLDLSKIKITEGKEAEPPSDGKNK